MNTIILIKQRNHVNIVADSCYGELVWDIVVNIVKI